MFLEKLASKFSGNLKWYDISLLKLCVVFFTLFLVTAWPDFRNAVLGVDWYIHLIIGVILAIPLMIKLFK